MGLLALSLPTVLAQQYGHQTPEFHLKVPIQECTTSGGCTSKDTSVVIDSNWRWTHEEGTIVNCYLGNTWNSTLCPDPQTCSQKCAIDGVDEQTWEHTYGVNADGKGSLNMSFVTNGTYSRNVGSRVFLLDQKDHYMQFKLLNKEFTFDVDGSDMPCGLNGALYFVEMDPDGGMSKHPGNKGGAELGTGYCDAQCPHDLKWINGEANIIGWNSSKTDPNAGFGHYGTCCAELDIWEANKISTQMTVHACDKPHQVRCEGIECGDNASGDRHKGMCDKDGCDYNPYRNGARDFFGPGPQFTLDSTRKMTVVTQFITDDGTDTGALVEMRRYYVQDGKVFQNSKASYGNYNSISDEQCNYQKQLFTDVNDFKKLGGLKSMGEAMGRGMTLVLSMWDDHEVGMIWLDAIDPYPVPAGKNGAPRGTCNQTSGDPKFVETNFPHSRVIYSNIKVGEFNTTWPASTPPTPPSPGPSPGPSPSPPTPGCPGGSLIACMALCPTDPPAAYQACVMTCTNDCAPVADEKEVLAEGTVAMAYS